MLFELDHLLLFLLVNWRQVVIDHVILPVVDHSVPLVLLGCVVMVSHVHSSVVCVIADLELVQFLGE